MSTLVEALHSNNQDGRRKETYRKLEPMFRPGRQGHHRRPVAAAIVRAEGRRQWSPHAPESATRRDLARSTGSTRKAALQLA